jgi:hypothetical protein
MGFGSIVETREDVPVSDTQAYQQFGNAVVPDVVTAVGRQVVNVILEHWRSQGNGCLVKPPAQRLRAAGSANGRGQTSTLELIPSDALLAFLEKFDEIQQMGPVRSLRKGDTGVGFTFETLLGIAENNDKSGDFMGMEVKTHRTDKQISRNKYRHLFLKAPTWKDGLKAKERVASYGYWDDKQGRWAFYESVNCGRTNTYGLKLSVDQEQQKVFLEKKGTAIGFWRFETLETRLTEKLTETVFVSADVQRERTGEELFHYSGVQYCHRPSVDRFVELIEDGKAWVEFRMHLKPDGSSRDHGCEFRVSEKLLSRLFDRTEQLRPLKSA